MQLCHVLCLAGVVSASRVLLSAISADAQHSLSVSVVPPGIGFGSSVASLNGSGPGPSLYVLVGAPRASTGRGMLFQHVLDNGAVTTTLRIDHSSGLGSTSLPVGARFGSSLAVLRGATSMLDAEVLVGSDELGTPSSRGAVYLLRLPLTSLPSSSPTRIAPGAAGLPASLVAAGAGFGASLARLGDCGRGDQCPVAVGAPYDAPSSSAAHIGAVAVLWIGSAGVVTRWRKLAPGQGGLAPAPFASLPNLEFGTSMAALRTLAEPWGLLVRRGNAAAASVQSPPLLLWLAPDGSVTSCSPLADASGSTLAVGPLSSLHSSASFGAKTSPSLAAVFRVDAAALESLSVAARPSNVTASASISCSAGPLQLAATSDGAVGSGAGGVPASLVPSSAELGASMAVADDGSILFVGAPSNATSAGAVYLFNNTLIDPTQEVAPGTVIGRFQSGAYANRASFAVSFTAAPGAALRVDCTRFNTELSFDFVRAFVGTSTSGVQLLSHSGPNCPGPFMAFGSITMSFTSDGSVVGSGFEFIISSVAASDALLPLPSPTPSPTAAATTSPSVTPSASATPTASQPVAPYPTAVQLISSAAQTRTFALGSYINNYVFERVFAPTGGASSLVVSCDSMNTESCCDKVRIYAGASATGSPVRTFAGRCSSASSVTVAGPVTMRFTSDRSITSTGFSFTIRGSTSSGIQPSPAGTPSPTPTPTGASNAGELIVTANSPRVFEVGRYSNSFTASSDFRSGSSAFGLRVECLFIATESCCDKARVYDRGTSSGTGMLVRTYAGSSCGAAASVPSGRMRIRFTSDGSITGNGVRLRVVAYNLSEVGAFPSASPSPSAGSDRDSGLSIILGIAGTLGGVVVVLIVVRAVARANQEQVLVQRRNAAAGVVAAAGASAGGAASRSAGSGGAASRSAGSGGVTSRAAAAVVGLAAAGQPRSSKPGGSQAGGKTNAEPAPPSKPFSLAPATGAAGGSPAAASYPPQTFTPSYAGPAYPIAGYPPGTLPPSLASGPLGTMGQQSPPSSLPGLPGLPVAPPAPQLPGYGLADGGTSASGSRPGTGDPGSKYGGGFAL